MKRSVYIRFEVIALLLTVLFSAVLPGCGETPSQQETVPPETKPQEIVEGGRVVASPDKIYEFTDDRPVFSLDGVYYDKPLYVELKTASEAEIRYTLDGSEPNENSRLYGKGIFIALRTSDFPQAVTIRARAYYPDGTVSAIATRSYFCSKTVTERFSTVMFLITGDPEQLTEGPDGIFYGDNCYQRGEEWERPVHIEVVNADGQRELSQYAGLRIYGGASRGNSIKSMKLYARKRYDPTNGKFDLDLFGTPDQNGEVIEKYDKLVLRNSGNDFQFGFIRDELCQRLAQQAGFSDYEAVIPAVAYLNGSYYGLFWLHESYCNDYFKEKYPHESAEGEFVIAEGSDQNKSEEEDGGDEVYAAEYNAIYNTYAYANLRNEKLYAQLCELIDVENYLDYFAFNIYINNNDWPQNNYKCYRYVFAEGEKAGEGVYDGRWRYLLHDTDFSMNLYGFAETGADYDNFAQIMDPNSNRYAPLFAALMKRTDCKRYFVDKIQQLSETVFSYENVSQVLETMHLERSREQEYMYLHMENLRKKGDQSFWANSSHLQENMENIRAFFAERGKYMMAFIYDSI